MSKINCSVTVGMNRVNDIIDTYYDGAISARDAFKAIDQLYILGIVSEDDLVYAESVLPLD